MRDLAIGVRLAIGGGRTSMARFALSTVGIAVAVAVLLLASSVDNAVQAREQRSDALQQQHEQQPGVDPLYLFGSGTDFRGERINVEYLYATGPNAPIPPGIPRLPTDGEMFVSPALAELLGSAEGELLRPRFPARIVGTVDPGSVRDPHELVGYLGSGRPPLDTSGYPLIYGFGPESSPVNEDAPLDPALVLLVLLGGVVLLTPVFIFVAASARIAGAERDRRLSAVRLVGADARQVRRIAAAESLVSAVAGLVLGAGLFLFARQFADDIVLFDASAYPADIVPSWWLALLTVLAVPLLAMLTTQFAMRRTIIEPLGVLRRQRPVRRRLWWRLGIVALGVGLLLWHGGTTETFDLAWPYSIAAGSTLLLVGVPLLLPWVVERVVARLRGGRPSWQLAVRRLQLDSGTSARVVSGVAVVLAGAIALQIILAAQAIHFQIPQARASEQRPTLSVHTSRPVLADLERDLHAVPEVRGVYRVHDIGLMFPDGNGAWGISVAECATVRALYGVADCADGDVFVTNYDDFSPVRPGETVTLVDSYHERELRWTAPDQLRQFAATDAVDLPSLLLTPGAVKGIERLIGSDTSATSVIALLDPEAPDAVELARNAVGPYLWAPTVESTNTVVLSDTQQYYVSIRNGLFAGSLFTLLLAGISLLAMALEQVRERRRPLAVLAASGVPRGTLARSLLWQTLLPVGLGVSLAVVTGLGIAALLLNLPYLPLPEVGATGGIGNFAAAVDLGQLGMLSGAALLLGVLVTALTLPFLRGATRPEGLRAE